MRKLPMEEIKDIPARQVIEDLRNCKYSLLQSAGCDKLRKEMRGPGIACRLVINVAWHTTFGGDSFKHDSRTARKLANFLSWGAPAEIHGTLPTYADSLVVGFNHPSLGEIIRFIAICLADYPMRKNLFPVNLPWYEVLMPVVDKLERLGVYITPIITPSTYEKMREYASEEAMQVLSSLRESFSLIYARECAIFAKEHSAIWVAPSATRRATVFRSEGEYMNLERAEPPTMTLIANAIVGSKVDNCVFVAAGVVPPENAGRGLNLFKQYTISFGEVYDVPMAASLMRAKCEHHRGRQFEYEFLRSICHSLTSVGAEHLLYP